MREEETEGTQKAFTVHVTRGTHCKQPITEGRYKGRRCGNAVPCKVHPVIRPMAARIRRGSVLW